MENRVDSLQGPLLVSWQMTRDCDLACLHCCTESAPGKALADELDAEEAARVARELVRSRVPYVMLCGGEPLVVPHFFDVAEILGVADIQLKIETNGQRLDEAALAKLARLPIRSVQISLDADTQATYAKQRPGGHLMNEHLLDGVRRLHRHGGIDCGLEDIGGLGCKHPLTGRSDADAVRMLQGLEDGCVAALEHLTSFVVADDHLARPSHNRTIWME